MARQRHSRWALACMLGDRTRAGERSHAHQTSVPTEKSPRRQPRRTVLGAGAASIRRSSESRAVGRSDPNETGRPPGRRQKSAGKSAGLRSGSGEPAGPMGSATAVADSPRLGNRRGKSGEPRRSAWSKWDGQGTFGRGVDPSRLATSSIGCCSLDKELYILFNGRPTRPVPDARIRLRPGKRRYARGTARGPKRDVRGTRVGNGGYQGGTARYRGGEMGGPKRRASGKWGRRGKG